MPGSKLYRPRDYDNALLAVKAVQDALVKAGVLPTDSRKNVRIGEIVLRGTKKEHRGECHICVTVVQDA